MDRDQALRIGIVGFLGVVIVGAGLNAFFVAEVVIALVQLVALLVGLAFIGYVIVRGELTKPQRSSVGNAGAGASITVSGAVIVSAAEFGAIGTFLGTATFAIGTVAFCYGAVALFDVELPRIERWASR